MSTLYELTAEYEELLSMAEDPEVDPEVLADTMEGLEGEIEDKADSYAKVLRQIGADIAGVKAEIDRLTDLKRRMEESTSRIKGSLETAMIATGKTKFKTTLFSFGIQKNPASLDVLDEKAIPEEFWVPQEPKLDKRAALAYVKENGPQSWGAVKQTEGLRIR